MIDKLDTMLSEEKHTQNRTIVRIKTSIYSSNGKLTYKREIIPLERKSYGYNFINDSVSDSGTKETFNLIVNLFDVKDGIYEVIVINEYRGWESGIIEDWDYKLFPYEN